MQRIRNIVFDMGNVLLDFDPERVVERFCADEAERALILRELFHAPEWLMADRGLMTRNELREILNLTPLPEPYGSQIPARGEYYDITNPPEDKSDNGGESNG